MTTFLLVRHVRIDANGKSLAGRAPHVHPGEEGRAQLGPLTDYLLTQNVQRICSSPLERARQTAAPLADRLGLPVEIADELIEVEFGRWTGRAFRSLDPDPQWQRFNEFRSGNRAPEGETLLEVQQRVVHLMLALRDSNPGETIALFTHGDVIRAALLYWLGMPIDFVLRLEVGPASVTAVDLLPTHVQLRLLNYQPAG